MKILVVDDHRLFRKAFNRLLKISVEYPVFCDEAQNGLEAIDKLQKEKFDLVFLDVSMPRMDGVETCKHIESIHIKVPIIVLTQFDNENLIIHFFKLGVHSFLTKDASVDELKVAIESAVSGKKYFPPEIDNMIQRKKGELSEVQRVEFTCQEKRLIQLLREGLISKEIALKMNLTVNTINTYRDRLLAKTKTSNVAQLISFGFSVGIIK
jgi:two-component system invasion response regulator UvrY